MLAALFYALLKCLRLRREGSVIRSGSPWKEEWIATGRTPLAMTIGRFRHCEESSTWQSMYLVPCTCPAVDLLTSEALA